MTLDEARNYLEAGPQTPTLIRAAKTIVACGDLLDRMNKLTGIDGYRMMRDSGANGDYRDGVADTLRMVNRWLEEALGVTDD